MASDCTTNIDFTGVVSCVFEPGPSADSHLYWYSPYNAAGQSSDGAYQITADDDVHRINRNTFPNNIPSITCAGGGVTGDVWRDAERSAIISPMCVNVDPSDPNKLSDTTPAASAATTSAECTSASGSWIDGPTAFSPAGLHGDAAHISYELRGCEVTCTKPTDLESRLNMVEIPFSDVDYTMNKSPSHFDLKVKCKPGTAPPLSVTDPLEIAKWMGSISLSDSDKGIHASACSAGGGDYSVTQADGSNYSPCQANCSMPLLTRPSGTTGVFSPAEGVDSMVDHEGYDFASLFVNRERRVGQYPSIIPEVSAIIYPHQQGDGGSDATTLSGHLDCAATYHKPAGSSNFIDPRICTAGGLGFSINDETASLGDQGCISQCDNQQSIPKKWDDNGAVISGAATPLWSSLPSYPYGDTPTADLVCSALPNGPWIPGPGSDVGGSATIESCGNLPGHTSSSLSQAYKDTRNKYAISGCYPACDPATDLCYNYKTERTITLDDGSTYMTEDEWRNQMGGQLASATSNYTTPLSINNIPFVHKQVVNNGNTGFNSAKEIFEWQIKCSTDGATPQCSDDAVTGSGIINLENLLGPTGMPGPADSVADADKRGGAPQNTVPQYREYSDAYCTHNPGGQLLTRGPNQGAGGGFPATGEEYALEQAKEECDQLDGCVGFTWTPRRPQATGSRNSAEMVSSLLLGDVNGLNYPRPSSIASCFQLQ